MRVLLFAVSIALGVSSAGLAQSPASASPATASGSEDEQARALFQAGRVAYEAGRYESALEHFRQAYELSGRAGLQYNIGQTADRLRLDEEALAAFELFLETVDEHPRIEEVQARVVVLRRTLAAQAAPPPEVVAATEAAEEERLERDQARTESSNTGLIIGISAGAAVAVAVAVVAVVVLSGGEDDPAEGNFGPSFSALGVSR